jgi:hypothetical protein
MVGAEEAKLLTSGKEEKKRKRKKPESHIFSYRESPQ